MKVRISWQFLTAAGAFLCAFLPMHAQTDPPEPAWWSALGTKVLTAGTPNDFAPVNAGQLKHVAAMARIHLDNEFWGRAGFEIASMVDGFTKPSQENPETPENLTPVNLGQLKAVAKPFYDRLIAMGYDTTQNLIARGYDRTWDSPYPWESPEVPANENYYPVNLGQLKMVFSFDLTGFIPHVWDEQVMEASFDRLDASGNRVFKSYVVVNEGSGKVLDVNGRLMTIDEEIVVNEWDGSFFQLWDIGSYPHKDIPGLFRFTNTGSSRMLYRPNDTNIIKQDKHKSADSNKHGWQIVAVDDEPGLFVIRSHNGTRIVDLLNDSIVHVPTPSTATDSQKWRIFPVKARVEESPNFAMVGWATMNGGTTGGAGGRVVEVSDAQDLVTQMDIGEELVVLVRGEINLGDEGFASYQRSGRYKVGSNTTIIGLPPSDVFPQHGHIKGGGLLIRNAHNVIVRNLKISGAENADCVRREPPEEDTDCNADAIKIAASENVRINHNDLEDSQDGLLDIVEYGGEAANYVSVSWNKFSDHNKVSIVNREARPELAEEFKTTFNHNWFSGRRRQPRVAHARVHALNNFYDDGVSGYGVVSGDGARVISEGDYSTIGVNGPYLIDPKYGIGSYKPRGTIFKGDLKDSLLHDQTEVDWEPSMTYPYFPNHALNVPEMVEKNAGVGHIEIPRSLLPEVRNIASSIDGNTVQLKWTRSYPKTWFSSKSEHVRLMNP